MDEEIDYNRHEKLRRRTAQLMDSLLWTFKQHYKAGSVYGSLGLLLDSTVFILAGILTYGLIWEAVPTDWMIGIAIFSAVLSGIKAAANPAKRSAAHYEDGAAFQELFDEFRDFVLFSLADEDKEFEEMQKRFEELAKRRLELKDDIQYVSSIWYRWIKWQHKLRRRNIYDEVDTSYETINRLTGEAELSSRSS